ncbi:MAG: hypothetical protein OEV00_05320 [Acidobacteriota bacterium]|nr:hypothetical protein [Acidobacteriota bacterium]MDH3784735.1 hypothetical protein [Acidobacteriota bacterium]
MADWFTSIPGMVLALAAAVTVCGTAAWAIGRRGGRYRGLPGWGGFWVLFSLLLVGLSRGPALLSFAVLAIVMFVSLRAYFFVAPVRPRDRYAILASYLAIPTVIWPAFRGYDETVLATLPILLFLCVPVFLSIGTTRDGLLDSMGRTIFGLLIFLFCMAHLGLLAHWPRPGILELYGILVILSEFVQRLAGRRRSEVGWTRIWAGIIISAVLAVIVGHILGPQCGLVEEDGGRAGFLVAIAVALGGAVSQAVWRDLALKNDASPVGRGAFLNRIVPAAYAAPVYFHYLNTFA